MLLIASTAATALAAATAGDPPRYWPHYGGNRAVEILDGDAWQFGLNLDPTFDSMSQSFGPDAGVTPNTTNVPSCFDNVAGGTPGYLGPRGVGMYRTTFDAIDPSLPARLQFQSCSFYCRVWINGKEIGDHLAGGYVAFHLEVPTGTLRKGSNELFVIADNRFNHTTAPMHTGGDFWHYGGIIRSVELHTFVKGPVLWRAYVQASGADATRESLITTPTSVDITLVLTSAESSSIAFTYAFDEGAAVSAQGTATNGQLVLKNVPVPNPTAWSTAEPNLHTLAVTLNGGSVIERFGLRTFGTDTATGRLTVNGKIQKLVGWNHHTQWPVTAASPTDDQMDADIGLLKRGGTTYVRGAHYPQDPRWLDRLDEAGMVMWAETLGPGVSTKNTQDWDFFMKYQLIQLQEMLDADLNHASIMTWGWFNEGPSNDPDACPAYAACTNYTRSRDPARFTTWASDKDLGDACLEHASLIAFNNYPSWYNGAKPSDQWNHFANAVAAGQTKSGATTIGKPMVISETGAGGIYEWDHNDTDVKWTLQYQSDIIAGDVETALSNGNISGITLWHFFDFKVDNAGGQENNTHCIYDHPPPTSFPINPPNCTYIKINGRPGGANHKGVLDFWRREKPAYQQTAAKYNKSNEIFATFGHN